jgi:hypothetical protein
MKPEENVADANLIVRYTANERANHWITAIPFVLLALSGPALFHPSMFWLTSIFGGGQWTRIRAGSARASNSLVPSIRHLASRIRKRAGLSAWRFDMKPPTRSVDSAVSVVASPPRARVF